MKNYIQTLQDLEYAVARLYYSFEENQETYTALLFCLKDSKHLEKFRKLLLKYMRITDSYFGISETQTLVILEDV